MQNHGFITGMAITLVWLLALLAVVIGDYFSAWTGHLHLLSFMFALPVTFIVWLVLNSVWFHPRRNFLIISLLMWSTLVSIYISLLLIWSINVRLFLLLGIPGQAIIFTWSHMMHRKR